MIEWLFGGAVKLEGGLLDSFNSGQLPQKPKYFKRFINITTGEMITTTDLDIKKRKRNRHLNNFYWLYKDLHKQKKISILGIVVNNDKYDNISKFMNMFNKKLLRKSIRVLGYVWQRDVGDIRFERHFHILIATTRMNNFSELFKNKKSDDYSVIFIPPKKMNRYLKKKEMYGLDKQRSYGRSRKFKSPFNPKAD